jgi:hypothetical protein
VDSGNVAVRALKVYKIVKGSRDSTNDCVRAGASDSRCIRQQVHQTACASDSKAGRFEE